jgi:hypothetical protein
MRITTICVLAVVLSVYGCGGGGGGPGNPNIRPSPNPENPSTERPNFSNPVRAGSYKLFVSDTTTSPTQDIFVQDLNNDNKEEVIIAGRQSQSAGPTAETWENSQLSIFSWNGSDQLENQTSSWFSGTDNQIIGTEPSVKFGDFNGDDNIDMVVGHSTDMEFLGPTVVFTNTGSSSFGRDNYNTNLWTHDVAVHDIDGDGFDDVLLGGYGRPVVMLGDASGTMTQITTDHFGMSGMAIGDFLGDGTTTFVFVDSSFDTTCNDPVNCSTSNDTKLFSFTQTGANTGTFTQLSILPTPIFDTDDKASLFGAADEHSHDIRALPFDFNNDGALDVVVISVSISPTDGRNRTEIQFLQNGGSGTFTDVTSTVRVDWDEFVNGDYNPQLVDVNDDGLVDILLSSQNFDSKESTRVLLQTSEGKYVQSYTDIFEDFVDAARDLESTKTSGLNTVRFLTGPDGNKYLVTSINLSNGTSTIYTTKLGDAGGSTAQASIELIQQVWPYVTDAVAAQILAGTAFTDFEGFDPNIHGIGVIDLQAAMQPIGELKMPTVNGLLTINGELSGLNLDGIPNLQAVDEAGRNYAINVSSMHTSYMETIWDNIELDDSITRMDYNFNYVINQGMFNYSPTDESGNYTMGIRSVPLYTDWYLQGQYTQLTDRNPWFHMSGMWGTINSSNTLETVVTHVHDTFQFHLGTMHTTTNFTPGLVTQVDPIDAVWAQISYASRGKMIKAALGTLPYIIGSRVKVQVPTTTNSGDGRQNFKEYDMEVKNKLAYSGSATINKNINGFDVGLRIYMNTNGYYSANASLEFNNW